MPSAYSFNQEVSALLAEWHGRTALFSYYSFAQMLTIGYAEVTPVRASLDKVDSKIQELEKARTGAYGALHEQVRSLIDPCPTR